MNTFSALSSERNQLQNQVASLADEKTTLQTQISTLNDEKNDLQTQVSNLTSENANLSNSLGLLAETVDAMHSNEWMQKISYNITAGTVVTKSFVLDRYGIVWDTVVDFSGTSVRVSYYYWYKGIRHYVISSSRSFTINNNPDVTYYGPQDYLYGTIKIDISPDWKQNAYNRIWIGYATLTQFPDVRMSGNMYIEVDI